MVHRLTAKQMKRQKMIIDQTLLNKHLEHGICKSIGKNVLVFPSRTTV